MNVYCIYFRNGKRYVGVETRPGRRINDHRNMCSLTKNRPQVIHLAIKKHGWENCHWRYLATNCSNEDGWALERFFIRSMKLQDPKWGYNKSDGGEHGMIGVKRSPESIRKRFETLHKMGRTGAEQLNTPRVIAKRVATRKRNGSYGPPPPTCRSKGRTPTSFKKGHKTWNKGTKGLCKPSSTSFTKGHVPCNRGIPMDDSTKVKISAAKRGKPPPHQKGFQKGAPAWNKGRPNSPEARRKMSEAHRGKSHFQNMVCLPAGPNGERRWFHPEQLV